jgi:hypothetical protein
VLTKKVMMYGGYIDSLRTIHDCKDIADHNSLDDQKLSSPEVVKFLPPCQKNTPENHPSCGFYFIFSKLLL